jgi:hypothetical protein
LEIATLTTMITMIAPTAAQTNHNRSTHSVNTTK